MSDASPIGPNSPRGQEKPLVPAKETTVDRQPLPPEVLSQIFSHVDSQDLPSVALVHSEWCQLVLPVGQLHVRELAWSAWSGIGDQKPGVSSTDSQALNEQMWEAGVWEATGLRAVQAAAPNLKGVLIERLKGFSPALLDKLAASSLAPRLRPLFGDLFSLPKLYLEAEKLKALPDTYEKWIALDAISRQLLEAGDLSGAQEVANTIGDEDRRSEALQAVSKKLLGDGDLSKAHQVAATIPSEIYRTLALEAVYPKFLEASDLPGALAVAHSIPFDGSKSPALVAISKQYLKAGDLAGARNVAQTIPIERDRLLLLQIIFQTANRHQV